MKVRYAKILSEAEGMRLLVLRNGVLSTAYEFAPFDRSYFDGIEFENPKDLQKDAMEATERAKSFGFDIII